MTDRANDEERFHAVAIDPYWHGVIADMARRHHRTMKQVLSDLLVYSSVAALESDYEDGVA